MDEEWKRTMDDFERVWPRVSGMGPPPPPPSPEPGPGPGHSPPPGPEQKDVEELERLIPMEARAEREYRAMAARTNGRAAVTLNRLAAGSRGILKKLQAEYYLRTGDNYPIRRTQQVRVRSFQEALRRTWLNAREAEKAYLTAAGRTGDAGLRALYGEAAAQKQKEQRELRALAQRLFR